MRSIRLVIYGWDAGAGTGLGVGLVTIDTVTAEAVDVNPAVSGSALQVQALEFAPDGTLYGGRNELYVIDPATGVLTLVGSGGYSNLRGLAFAVPEPSTWALAAIALLMMVVVSRRRSTLRNWK